MPMPFLPTIGASLATRHWLDRDLERAARRPSASFAAAAGPSLTERLVPFEIYPSQS